MGKFLTGKELLEKLQKCSEEELAMPVGLSLYAEEEISMLTNRATLVVVIFVALRFSLSLPIKGFTHPP